MKRMTCLTTAALAGAAALSFTASSSAGLIHRYSFDDADITTGKTSADLVGSADATPTGSGGGTNISTGTAGKIGQAYSFVRDSAPSGGGTVNYADFENLITLASGAVPSGASERTIALFFNQDTDNAGQDKLFGYGTNVAGQALDISLEGGGIRLRHFGGNITYGSGLDFDGVDAGWHHLAVRVNASASTFADIDVFLDGNLLAVTGTGGGGTGVALNTAASPFGIATTSIDTGGAIPNGFDGSLDELRIYDNALTDQEIAALAVPEPGSLALIVMGGAMLVRRRRSA